MGLLLKAIKLGIYSRYLIIDDIMLLFDQNNLNKIVNVNFINLCFHFSHNSSYVTNNITLTSICFHFLPVLWEELNSDIVAITA